MTLVLQLLVLRTLSVAASLQIGAITAGASKEEQDHLYKFGINMGIAFQLKDDLFDLNNMKLVESYKLNNLIYMNDKLKENIIKTPNK